MTPETKGQPEPVAYPGPVLYQVVGRDPEGADEPEFISFEPSGMYADIAVAQAVEAGWEDVQARPLYDYDVPALLEALWEIRQECYPLDGGREALMRIEVLADEALAAAREESDV